MTQQVRRGRIAAIWFVGLGLLWADAYAGELVESRRVSRDSTDARSGYTPPVATGSGFDQPDGPTGPKGRYQTLLKKIEVPNDQQSYGDFYDYGYYAGTSYAG